MRDVAGRPVPMFALECPTVVALQVWRDLGAAWITFSSPLKSIIERVAKHQTEGNRAWGASNFPAALDAYDRAIGDLKAIVDGNPVLLAKLLSNKAAALMKLSRYGMRCFYCLNYRSTSKMYHPCGSSLLVGVFNQSVLTVCIVGIEKLWMWPLRHLKPMKRM